MFTVFQHHFLAPLADVDWSIVLQAPCNHASFKFTESPACKILYLTSVHCSKQQTSSTTPFQTGLPTEGDANLG